MMPLARVISTWYIGTSRPYIKLYFRASVHSFNVSITRNARSSEDEQHSSVVTKLPSGSNRTREGLLDISQNLHLTFGPLSCAVELRKAQDESDQGGCPAIKSHSTIRIRGLSCEERFYGIILPTVSS